MAPVATADPKSSTTRALDVYRAALVLDANAMPLCGDDFDSPKRLAELRDSGITAFKATLGGADGDFEFAVAEIAAAQALIERRPGHFIKVTRHADLARAKAENKTAVIFSFEAATMLDGNLEHIELFRNLGVLVMQLGYNHATPFGCGCLDGETGGVTELGRAAIARMQELGITLDLSHANTQTTIDGITLSTKPPVFTHTGCREVFMHPRNKRDEEMRALAEHGGVMGIYMLPFLTPDDRQPMLADFMQHLLHALDVCGEDHVGIGTDIDIFEVGDAAMQALREEAAERRRTGVGAPGENRLPWIPDLNTPRKLERVADALLQHGYPANVVDKILGRNFSRVFKETWID
ncbi:MAG TPA: membrane dipeptidase [Rhodanobacteraceae bacterium]|nr:membrane dipeptidase [Rhodanobacteraceae bacterium]